MENRQTQVIQLQEELKEKDDLLRNVREKRQARTRAHVETVDLLARKENYFQSSQQCQSKYDALEASLRVEVAHKEKSRRKRCRERGSCSVPRGSKRRQNRTKKQTDEEIKLLILQMEQFYVRCLS
eukprot:superscaffoldBa00001691_g11645